MDRDISSRLQEAVDSGKSFEQQLTEAKSSGRPFGLVSDFNLGQHIIYNTAEEIADAQARTVAEAALPIVKTLEERVAVLEANANSAA